MLPESLSHSASMQRCDTLIVDFNDLLTTRYTKIPTPIPPETLHNIFRSSIWFDYEKGVIGEDECYAHLATECAFPASTVAAAIQAARVSTSVDREAVQMIQLLKERACLRVFSMSNLSSPDWDSLQKDERLADVWTLFDRTFTSAATRERKPNLGFYRHVLDSTGLDPRRTVYVDGRMENVVSAVSFGMKGIVFAAPQTLWLALRPLFRDPIADADRWLRQRPKQMWSVTDTGVAIEENFGQLLLLEVTQDESLANVVRLPRLTNFFRGKGVLTTAAFPNDLDTTSIACTVLEHFTREVKDSIMDEMLSLRNKDGLVQTYFDASRPRIDPVVCINVLTFFHLNGRGSELAETVDWVYDVLTHRAYEGGTLYYHSGDSFLYFLSRLLRVSKPIANRFRALFGERMLERYGAAGDALALAMRVFAAASIGMRDVQDYERLLGLQNEDGSWPLGWFYRNGSSGILTGNQGVTTALATAAIRNYREL